MNEFVKKNFKNNEKNVRYDFLPSMIEIVEKPANPIGVIIAFVIIGLIISTIVWSCICRLDIAVSAPLTVVYDENGIRFEVYISNKDIYNIEIGNNVNVYVGALNDTKYEKMVGEVVEIENNPIFLNGIGNAYKTKIKIADYPNDLRNGMEGNCDIIIGTRSVMNYFLEPLKSGFNDSLKET